MGKGVLGYDRGVEGGGGRGPGHTMRAGQGEDVSRERLLSGGCGVAGLPLVLVLVLRVVLEWVQGQLEQTGLHLEDGRERSVM